ncbi:MAG TPA: flagellar FlbD family protein [Candidatus Paceibacterota bacterium]|nr:flagellar FlbD family protein [Candidatus Paceibacterota bacterium]
MIEVKRLDGSMMHLNEDLLARVEHAAGEQSAIYMLDGGHIVVANDPLSVVEMIRAEKVELFRRVFQGPSATPRPDGSSPGVTRLTQVREQ